MLHNVYEAQEVTQMGSLKKWYPRFSFLNGFASAADIFGARSLKWEEFQSLISSKRRNEAVIEYYRNAVETARKSLKQHEKNKEFKEINI